MELSQVKVPREFFRAERDKFYRDWLVAIHREFIQNSIDAGSKRIDVTIEDAQFPGEFGKKPSDGTMTRLCFSDDGVGMDKEVLDSVYFSLGSTTKKSDDSVGGYGRARLMSCFANASYAIRSTDRVVEGSGADYVNMSVPEAIDTYGQWISGLRSALEIEPDYDARMRMRNAIATYEGKQNELQSNNHHHNGCRIEVYIDPNDREDSSYNYATSYNLKKSFEKFVRQCELQVDLYLNGEKIEKNKKTKTKRKDFYATVSKNRIPEKWLKSPKIKLIERSNGDFDVNIGTVYEIDEKHAEDSDKGNIKVRVDGSCMFEIGLGYDNKASLIIELHKSLARSVLTSNRDGFREPYDKAVDVFRSILATDVSKALENNEDDRYEILKGGLGLKTAARAEDIINDVLAFREAVHSGDLSSVMASTDQMSDASKSVTASRLQAELDAINNNVRGVLPFYSSDLREALQKGSYGVSAANWLKFMQSFEMAASVEQTVLGRFTGQNGSEHDDPARDAREFFETAKNQSLAFAMEKDGGYVNSFIISSMLKEQIVQQYETSRLFARTLEKMNDIPIYKAKMRADREHIEEALAKKLDRKIHSAIAPYDPRKWDLESGKGLKPRKLLAAWSAAIDEAIEALFRVKPDAERFHYTVGWYFSQATYQSYLGYNTTEAVHFQPSGQTGKANPSYFLLNPLNSNLDPTFSLTDMQSRHRLIVTAIHEVCHVLHKNHGDSYAYMLTDLMKQVDFAKLRQIDKKIVETCKAIDHLYGSGRNKVIPMDSEQGIRPVQQLAGGATDLKQATVDEDMDETPQIRFA